MDHTQNMPLLRHQRIRAILDARMLRRHHFSKEQIAYLRTQGILPGMAGGADDDDDDTSSDSGGGAGTATRERDEDSDEDDDAGKNSGDGDSDEDGKEGEGKPSGRQREDEDDSTKVPKSELQRLRRIAREADEAEKKRKREAERELEKKKKEEGRWQELLDEERTSTTRERERADKAETELRSFKRQIRVQRIATALGWKDPTDAYLYIEDEEDMDDDRLTEAALTRVAKRKDWLVNPKKATGGPSPGNGTGGLTMEDIKRMSQDEINRRWDEVQKVMARGA